MMQVTRIPYEYTDARGANASGVIYVSGTFTREQVAVIEEALDDGEFFIPAQVGLPTLQQELSSFPCSDDHAWHILEPSDFVVLEELPADKTIACTAEDFANRFDNIEWDVAGECARLGIE